MDNNSWTLSNRMPVSVAELDVDSQSLVIRSNWGQMHFRWWVLAAQIQTKPFLFVQDTGLPTLVRVTLSVLRPGRITKKSR